MVIVQAGKNPLKAFATRITDRLAS